MKDDVMKEAECLYTAEQVSAAYDRMAAAIEALIRDEEPLILCLMNGGLVPTAALLERFGFPLELGYAHPTRYRGGTRGGEIVWRAPVPPEVAGRSVLAVDDILDEGVTLKAVVDACRAAGAKAVRTAVLVQKRHGRNVGIEADFVGLEVDDRYVFGCGMDYQGYLRNLPGIYALGEPG